MDFEVVKKQATHQVEALLATQDDLEVVSEIRLNILRKKTAVDAQLKSIVESQLADAAQGVQLLKESSDTISYIRKDFESINERCAEVKELIGEYPLVKEVNCVRTNLQTTLNELEKMHKIPERKKWLEQEVKKEDPDILHVSRELIELEQRRGLALQQAATMPREREALEEIFRGLEKTRSELEDHLWANIANVLTVVQKRPDVIVKTLQVIEREEIVDQGQREPQLNYEVTCRQLLRESVRVRFIQQMGSVDVNDVAATLVALGFVADDIVILMDHVAPCFPPKYTVFPFFVREYHQQVHTTVRRYWQQDMLLGNQDILLLLAWTNDYEGEMGHFGLGTEDLQPSIHDGDAEMTRRYLNGAKERMTTYAENIVQRDLAVGLMAENGPMDEVKFDADGKYWTGAVVDLFSAMHSELELVEGVNHGRFLLDTFQLCVQILQFYQDTTTAALEKRWRTLDITYLCAVANNCSRAIDLVEAFEERWKVKMEAPYDEQTNSETADLGFQRLGTSAASFCVSQVFEDLKDHIAHLFGDAWFEMEKTFLVQDMMATFADYFSEEFRCVDEYFFGKIVVACLVRFVHEYVRQLLKKKHNLIEGETLAQMQADERAIRDVFKAYLKPNTINSHLEILKQIGKIIRADPETVVVFFEPLVKKHPDVTVAEIQHILKCRLELTSNQVAEAVHACSLMLSKVGAKSDADGIFSRIRREK